jgi:hypothetical protein
MDSLDLDALTSLTARFGALMPSVSAPQLPLQVAVDPVSTGPAGIGGVVGLSRQPVGEILGRRLKARARVRVQTTVEASLDAAVTEVTAAVLAGDRAQQRADGILLAELDEIGDETAVTANGGGTRFGREVRFQLLFEHIVPPTTGEGVIDEVHASVFGESVIVDAPAAGPAPAAPSLLAPFAVAATPAFDVVDDLKATKLAPSAWAYDPPSRRFTQTSGIWGGNRAASPNKPGTYLLLRSGPFTNVRFSATLGSTGDGAIGLVFRYAGPEDFYFFIVGAEPGYRLLGRKAGGTFATIAESSAGRTAGTPQDVLLTVQGAEITVTVDGDPPLTGHDTSHPGPGRAGLMTHNDPGGFFSVGELSEL